MCGSGRSVTAPEIGSVQVGQLSVGLVNSELERRSSAMGGTLRGQNGNFLIGRLPEQIVKSRVRC